MQSERKDLKEPTAVVLHRIRVVEPGQVLFLHHASKVLDFRQHRREGHGLLLQPRSIEPNDAVQLETFPADQGQRHVGPPPGRFRGRMGPLEFVVVHVQGEFGVKIVGPDDGPRTLGFARADVQTAERVPDHPAHMRFDRAEPILGPVAVQSHALGDSDGGSAEHGMRPRNLTSTERDL